MFWVSAFRELRRQEVGIPCSGTPEVTKRDIDVQEDVAKHFGKIDISGFERWKGREPRQQDSRNREIRYPEKVRKGKVLIRKKGTIMFIVVRGVE
jgi:hypothetical protein